MGELRQNFLIYFRVIVVGVSITLLYLRVFEE